jgi:acyl-CoA synthetase (AMP-forming)/AMP-acid ligase II
MEKVYQSIYPDIYVPTDVSLHQFLCARNPDDVPDDKVILEDLSPPKKSLTYGGLRRNAAIVAGNLSSKYGVKAGDAVVILAQNSVDYSLLAHSVMWAGGIIVGINWLASAYDIQHYLLIARPKLVVVDAQFRGRMQQALNGSKRISPKPPVVDLGGDSPESLLGVALEGSQPIEPFDLSGKDNRKYPAAIVFSSGTSGKPKGVQWSHYGAIAHLLTSRGATPETQNCREREVFYAPFAHMFGLLGGVLGPSYVGNYVLAMKQFNYDEWLEANSRIRATGMKMVPPTAVAISKDPKVEKLQLGSVNTIVCAGGTLQAEVVKRLQHVLKGVSIVQSYGMSEAAVCGLRPVRSVEKSGSVGRLFPSV